MADSKNTQPAPAGLPEKEWFTLDEVAARWGCTVNDLLHYGTNKKLTLCFRPGCQPIHYKLAPCFIDADGSPQETLEENDIYIEHSEKCHSPNLSNWTLVCIPAPHLFHISEHSEWKGAMRRIDCMFDIKFPPLFSNKILGRTEAFTEPGSGDMYIVRARFGRDRNSPPPEFHIAVRDILVPQQEVERFEQAHRIGKYAGRMPNLEENPKAVNRPWAHLVNSENKKTSAIYKRDANRIWESLTDEEKKTWAREAMARNRGIMAAAGRELGITANGVKYIMETKP